MANRSFTTLVLVVALSIGMASAPDAARGCEFTDDRIYAGPLVVTRGDGASAEDLPQNLVLLREEMTEGELAVPLVIGEDAAGNDVSALLEPIGGGIPVGGRAGRLYRSRELLPQGTRIGGLVVGDYVDDAAPVAPVVLAGSVEFHSEGAACAGNSCGDYTDLSVAFEPASDDHVRTESLVYLVYLGKSAAKAAQAPVPIGAFASDGFGSHSVWSLVDDEWSESDAFVCLSAVDAAGNESARTPAFRVNTEPGACAFRGWGRAGRFQLLVFGAAAAAMFARRARRGVKPVSAM